MKLLESGRLEAVSSLLSSLEIGDLRVTGHLESYSCKVAGFEQKTLYKRMAKEGGASDIVALSPPQDSCLSSSLDSLESEFFTPENLEMYVISRKTLFNLITTLNLSFHPDYDFSDAKSHEFSRATSLAHVWSEIDSRLGQSSFYNSRLRQRLYEEIEAEIGGLRNAEIYMYKPDLTSDPFSEAGCVWSFNFFFYHPKLKRVVFLTCRAMNPSTSASESEFDGMED
jgi:hypothetical protein